MNVRLLRRIAKVIQEKPEQFDIDYWHARDVCGGRAHIHPEFSDITECGTAHCIAGWAQVLSSKADRRRDTEEEALRVLGLTPEQGDRLFLKSRWPYGYRGLSPSPEQAAARIEHFIKTKGEE